MDDAGAQAPQLLWINWTAHVVSFHQEEGFETVTFPDHDTMLAYVFQKTAFASSEAIRERITQLGVTYEICH